MIRGLHWLALEVKYLDRASSFYEAFLELDVRRESDHEVALAVGETDLVLREPSTVPRGGLHTHYAMAIPAASYDSWYERLDRRFDLVEHEFGGAKSLYFYDPDGNCVELGQRDAGDRADPDGIFGLWEIVLEVEALDRARKFYERLGFELTGEDDERPRVRMTAGEFDLELWEPQLGLADGRGGVHVDFGFGVEDPEGLANDVEDWTLATSLQSDGSVRLRDVDGHYVTLVPEE